MARQTKQERQSARVEAFWAPRYAAAATMRERAAVEWNRIRADIRKVSPDRRQEAWELVVRHLQDARAEMSLPAVDVDLPARKPSPTRRRWL